jgi:hypothetical protein
MGRSIWVSGVTLGGVCGYLGCFGRLSREEYVGILVGRGLF